jgi:HPt (histidine-containing phosphotransfer) domain-containing protein
LPDNTILDLTRLEEAFEDDTAGIVELLHMALETGAKHLRTLEDGLAAGDANAVARAAHGIKGSAGNVGALHVASFAAELDQRARTGDLSGARERIDAIANAYEALAREIDAYRASVSK